MPDVIVDLDELATSDEVAEVQEVMREAGLDAEVRVLRPREERPPEEQIGNGFFWIVIVGVGYTMVRFIDGFAGEAGKDAYAGLKAFVGSLRRARRRSRAPDGSVEITSADDTRLLLGSDADEAFEELKKIDLNARRGKHLRWDEQRREWVPY